MRNESVAWDVLPELQSIAAGVVPSTDHTIREICAEAARAISDGTPEHWLPQVYKLQRERDEANAYAMALRGLVDRAVAVLAAYAPPDGPSQQDTISALYSIFDGPEYRAALAKNPTPREAPALAPHESGDRPRREGVGPDEPLTVGWRPVPAPHMAATMQINPLWIGTIHAFARSGQCYELTLPPFPEPAKPGLPTPSSWSAEK